jgi:hypothetical protein
MGKSTALMDKHGCYFTMLLKEARRALPRLRDYLSCDAVGLEPAPETAGEAGFVIFNMSAKWHGQARAFLEGWQAGQRGDA